MKVTQELHLWLAPEILFLTTFLTKKSTEFLSSRETGSEFISKIEVNVLSFSLKKSCLVWLDFEDFLLINLFIQNLRDSEEISRREKVVRPI